jgi:hypothetical protein
MQRQGLLILTDISFEEFLSQFEKESIRSLLKCLILLCGNITNEQYIVFKEQSNALFLSEDGLNSEQSESFLNKCNEYRKRYTAHETVFEILKTIGINDFLQQFENELIKIKLINFISLCGQLNDSVFSSMTSVDMSFNEFGLEGENITSFQQICTSFREKYKQHNILASLSSRRNGIQYISI